MLRPGTNVRSALLLAAELSGRSEDLSGLRVPAKETLRRAEVKLDLALMLWSRQLWNNGYQAQSCLLADSSEQNHYDFFCQRMDSLEVPPKLSVEIRSR